MSGPISPELVLFPDSWVSNIPRYFSFAPPVCDRNIGDWKEKKLVINPMSPTPLTISNGKAVTHKRYKKIDYTAIADWLRVVCQSDCSLPTIVFLIFREIGKLYVKALLQCKIQKHWCTVTVAPTIEHRGGHSRTPATRGETRCPGGVSVSCLASRTRHECPRHNERITNDK